MDLHARRIHSQYPDLSKEDIVRDGIIVFGAGNHGKLITSNLLSQKIIPECIVDNNKNAHGSYINGIKVLPLDSVSDNKNVFVLLASEHIQSMVADCAKYGIDKWIIPASLRKFCSIVGDFGIYENVDEYSEKILLTHTLLNDAISKELLKKFVIFHHTFELNLFAAHDPGTYFPADLHSSIDYSRFIDAGAFTGDTLVAWINYYKSEERHSYFYHAFEPGREQFAELQTFVEGLPDPMRGNIFLHQAALGEVAGSMRMCGTGMSANLVPVQDCANAENSVVDVLRIDDLFHKESPSIIKADVEGFELELLKGAEEVIRRCRPSIAISVYHHFADIWKIPLWIHDLHCGYRLYLRHHSPTYDDTVCYAIVDPTGRRS
jgi:FkbM family methyltransferase